MVLTLKYEWIPEVASLRILKRELKTFVLHLRWGNWRIYSSPCLSLILKGKSWNKNNNNWQELPFLYNDNIKGYDIGEVQFEHSYYCKQNGNYCPYHRVTLSNYMDMFCLQFNWLISMWTFLEDTCDFNSTTKCEQPLFEGGGKKRVEIKIFKHAYVIPSYKIQLKSLRIIQLWSGNNLQWLQGAPIIHIQK